MLTQSEYVERSAIVMAACHPSDFTYEKAKTAETQLTQSDCDDPEGSASDVNTDAILGFSRDTGLPDFSGVKCDNGNMLPVYP